VVGSQSLFDGPIGSFLSFEFAIFLNNIGHSGRIVDCQNQGRDGNGRIEAGNQNEQDRKAHGSLDDNDYCDYLSPILQYCFERFQAGLPNLFAIACMMDELLDCSR